MIFSQIATHRSHKNFDSNLFFKTQKNKFIKNILNFLSLCLKIAIFVLAIFFGYSVLFKIIIAPPDPSISLIMVLFIIICLIINFVLSRKYKHKFSQWDEIFRRPNLFFVLPPFSIIASAAGLAVYILGFIYYPMQLVWNDSFGSLEYLQRLIGLYSILAPIALIIICFLFVGFFFISVKILNKKNSFIAQSSVVVLYIILLIGCFVLIQKITNLDLLEELSYQVIRLSAPFFPIYWFYYLFIHSRRIDDLK